MTEWIPYSLQAIMMISDIVYDIWQKHYFINKSL